MNAPALVPEQLGLQEILGQRRAVHRDEDLGRPRAVRVDGAGDQLLAGARLALDEDVRLRARGLADQLEDRLDRRALADDLVEAHLRRQPLAQAPVLVAQPALRESPLHGQPEDVVRRQRLQEVVEGPQPHGLDGRLHRAVTRDDDDGDVRVQVGRAPQDREPVGARHLEVGEHDVGMLGFQQPQGVLAVRRAEAAVRRPAPARGTSWPPRPARRRR